MRPVKPGEYIRMVHENNVHHISLAIEAAVTTTYSILQVETGLRFKCIMAFRGQTPRFEIYEADGTLYLGTLFSDKSADRFAADCLSILMGRGMRLEVAS